MIFAKHEPLNSGCDLFSALQSYRSCPLYEGAARGGGPHISLNGKNVQAPQKVGKEIYTILHETSWNYLYRLHRLCFSGAIQANNKQQKIAGIRTQLFSNI